jgi:hypothetical protein
LLLATSGPYEIRACELPGVKMRSSLRWQIEQEVGNAHRRYELDMLFVFRIPIVKGLTIYIAQGGDASAGKWSKSKMLDDLICSSKL